VNRLASQGARPARLEATMTRGNTLYLIVGALVVAVVVLGYLLYDAKREPKGVQINVGPGGLSIKEK
jgi:hypothetical protein